MNRAGAELNAIIATTEPHIEQLEREAARRRWAMDIECAAILARMDATTLRRELTR
jgi:hypothetical protein